MLHFDACYISDFHSATALLDFSSCLEHYTMCGTSISDTLTDLLKNNTLTLTRLLFFQARITIKKKVMVAMLMDSKSKVTEAVDV